MEIKEINIDTVKGMENNPRKISDFDFNNLKNNLKEFGTVQPIIVNKDLTIISGHQRCKALKEMGVNMVPVIILNLDTAKAKALSLSLNRISGEFDYVLLDKFLKDMDESVLSLSGFSEKELSNFKVKYDFTDIAEEMKGLEEEKKEELDWKAKVEKKDYERVKSVFEEIKHNKGLGKYYSEYANGEVLLGLVEEILSKFKDPSEVAEYFEIYEQGNLKKNGEALINLAEEHKKNEHPIS
ncbi:ParB N-terminal domain-containing protein [Candidatus Dojkabacteria bacterium]|jgi:ParB-like chromosome segregation protein Spo0J|nr:ParB N-terminal domain-containing protein [Candidatus Dojkabacteria bacterium]